MRTTTTRRCGPSPSVPCVPLLAKRTAGSAGRGHGGDGAGTRTASGAARAAPGASSAPASHRPRRGAARSAIMAAVRPDPGTSAGAPLRRKHAPRLRFRRAAEGRGAAPYRLAEQSVVSPQSRPPGAEKRAPSPGPRRAAGVGERFRSVLVSRRSGGRRGRGYGAVRAGRGAGAEPGRRDAGALPAGRLSSGTDAGAAGAGCRGRGGGSSEAFSGSGRRAALLNTDASVKAQSHVAAEV